MNTVGDETLKFERLADAIERLLSQYGAPYRRGTGDFSLNHDYYGNREIGVIFLRPLFSELVLKQMQSLLREEGSNWEIWVTFEDDAQWNGHDQIAISSHHWRAVEPR